MTRRRTAHSAVFNGASSYITIPSWTPTGKFGVFVQFGSDVPSATIDAFLLTDASNRYVSIRGSSAKSQFGASFPGSALVLTPSNGYAGIVIESGKLSAFDGNAWTTNANAEIVTNYTYTTIGRRGSAFSPMSLVWLLLYDYQTPTNSRFYLAQPDGTMTDVVYGATQPTCVDLVPGRSRFNTFTPAWACHEVKSVANWESKYTPIYGVNHPGLVTSPTINTDFGENFAWSGQYWVQTYLVMHSVTGNDLYLTRAKTLIDYMFSMTDSARHARGEIFCADRTGLGGIDDRYANAPKQYLWTGPGGVTLTGTPTKGWRRRSGDLWEVIVLLDGAITSGIARYCHYVLSRPALSARHAGAITYLAQCADIVRDHNFHWSSTKNVEFQSYFYSNPGSNSWTDSGLYSNPVAYNHVVLAATTMAICNRWLTPDTDFSDKITKTLAFFRKYVWTEVRGGSQWWYAFDITPGNRKSQDINHAGNLELSCFYWLTRLGYMTEGEVMRLTKGFTEYVEFSGSGAMRYRVDGSYKFAGDQMSAPADAMCVAQNAMPAAVFDPALIPLSRRVAAVMAGGATPQWAQWGFFNVAAHDLAVKAGAVDIAL